MSSISINQWRQDSKDGKRCGILGCDTLPTFTCEQKQCGMHYCDEHKHIHLHSVNDTAFKVL